MRTVLKLILIAAILTAPLYIVGEAFDLSHLWRVLAINGGTALGAGLLLLLVNRGHVRLISEFTVWSLLALIAFLAATIGSVIGDVQGQDCRIHGDAVDVGPVIVGGDDRRNRCAVVVRIGNSAIGGDVGARRVDPARELRKAGVDPRIDHRDLDPAARGTGIVGADRFRRRRAVRRAIFRRVERG